MHVSCGLLFASILTLIGVAVSNFRHASRFALIYIL